MKDKILQNITKVLQRINDAEHHYDRLPGSVSLLAVSKGRTVADIQAAINAGVYQFGESYVQEALLKMQALSEINLDWHFIGAIQNNKVKKIAENFSWVHSVASLEVAERLSLYRPSSLPPLNVCLQVNISNETTKKGMSVEELFFLAEEVQSLPHIVLRGLMAIPMKEDNVYHQHAIFRKMFQLYSQLNDEGYALDTLSMGMSGDFEAAIAEGATLIRVGTAVFGERMVDNTFQLGTIG